jgi:hypothetical protein
MGSTRLRSQTEFAPQPASVRHQRDDGFHVILDKRFIEHGFDATEISYGADIAPIGQAAQIQHFADTLELDHPHRRKRCVWLKRGYIEIGTSLPGVVVPGFPLAASHINELQRFGTLKNRE